ncbi:MAG TPA: nucleotide sugar dehydrogenase, partial [Polyangiales bacterium]
MKVTMVGTGYVGLVSGVCFAETGNDVTCLDIDERKVEKLRAGEVPIFEPGLDEMLIRNRDAGRLTFTSNVAEAIGDADVVFIAVGTPSRADGGADLSQVDAVALAVREHATREVVLVNKSTVPVGTNARVRRLVEGGKARIHVVSNPEFLKEGDAIVDFMKPDRIVLGCVEKEGFAHDLMNRLYHPVSASSQKVVWMDPASAEVTKYVANTMLAMRISFMNEIAALCEAVGADVHSVRQGVGRDARIGPQFL